MIKKFLIRLRDFWTGQKLDCFLRRNDQELENKRRLEDPLHLDYFGYKVYSQNDEDGIIQEIFKRIGITNTIFVEFGVGDGIESNGHFLLFNGWKGLWIDGNKKMFNHLRHYFSNPLLKGQLTAINAFITTDNINRLISEEGKITGEIDLLSIDIDGNDYWIWEKINCIQPRVVIIEYNAKFPPPCEWIMDYDPNHMWDGSDKHGASLKSLEILGNRLGYALVGTNKNGLNAFFVKKELTKGLFAEPASAENLYHAWSTGYISSGHNTKKYIGKVDPKGKEDAIPASHDELIQEVTKKTVISAKIITQENLSSVLENLRLKNKKIVFTNGVFDIIHRGHISYLQKARQLGDILILGLNTDASVKRIKGEGRPINHENDRAYVLSAIEFVDYIIMFSEDTPYNLLKAVQPDILVKGADYKIEDVVGKEFATETVLISFEEGYSSTNIINQVFT